MSMTDVSWLFVPALLLLLAGGYLQQRKSAAIASPATWHSSPLY